YDHAHSQRHAQVRMPHHALGHLVNVIGYQGVFQPLCRELEVPGKPVPQSNLALRGIQVPGTLIDVAFSDIFYVPVLFLLCGCGDSRKTAQKQESQNRGDSWTHTPTQTQEMTPTHGCPLKFSSSARSRTRARGPLCRLSTRPRPMFKRSWGRTRATTTRGQRIRTGAGLSGVWRNSRAAGLLSSFLRGWRELMRCSGCCGRATT